MSSDRERIEELLYLYIRELEYVRNAETLSLAISGQWKFLIEQGLEALEITSIRHATLHGQREYETQL